MHFVITCLDKPGHGAVRAENRPAHLEYLKANGDKILVAGPILSEDGERPTGSLLIMAFADRAEAEAFAAGDPYNRAGLFESVTIKPWRKALP
ncbi:MAG: YciI family protein [Kiloniellaceae bacterium]